MLNKTMYLLLTLSLLGITQTASAQTEPCFDFVCDWQLETCAFNASCSTGTPFVWRVFYDWGDGTNSGPWPRTLDITHDYSATFGFWTDVTLTVIPWGDDIQTVTCEVIFDETPFGPGLPPGFASGRCTADGVDYGF